MIATYLKKNWWKYALGVLFLIAVDLLQLIPPRLTGRLVDLLKSSEADENTLLIFILGVLAAAGGMMLSRFWWRFFIIGTAHRFSHYARLTLFEKLLSLTQDFYDRTLTGDLMARFTNDINAVRMMLGPAVVMATDAVVLTVITVAAMGGFVSWRLTVLASIPLPFLALISLTFGKMIHHRFRKVQEGFSEITHGAEESVSGIRVIKTFAVEDKMEERYSEVSLNYFKAQMSLIKVWGLFFPLIGMIGTSASLIALIIGGRMVIYDQITLGEFVTFNQYLGMLVWPMMAVGWVLNIIQRSRASYKRLMEILETKPSIQEPKNPVNVTIKGNIEVKNLDFAYPNTKRPVLKNINMKIEAGSFVGIAGKTGSGKSTIVKLLLKLYPVERGRIFFEGVDINDISSEHLRKYVTYVPQEAFLFSTTVKENIAFPVDKIEENEVKLYAQVAAVHDDIVELPQGYRTVVGERGVTLSGGQKQRITLARGLVKRSPVIILDDSLSAVDAQTEEAIINHLRESVAESTLIVVSHRLKVLSRADIIYVFDDGEIVEAGRHTELIERDGLYRRMYELQMLEERFEEDAGTD
ncbi:MAG TPA: ABC transporter ATP-binding protein [Thermotogae bacterium]|nr:ATP-binding cassette, subfamily multidrug efflux pump [Thermotogota bacterium]HCZ07345.1 ABC transporter ATP-binding protein [Thermotogota bacterium]